MGGGRQWLPQVKMGPMGPGDRLAATCLCPEDSKGHEDTCCAQPATVVHTLSAVLSWTMAAVSQRTVTFVSLSSALYVPDSPRKWGSQIYKLKG